MKLVDHVDHLRELIEAAFDKQFARPPCRHKSDGGSQLISAHINKAKGAW
ncbi:Uncharacterised protein [Vibrio cholerae]|nr:Uncharacterised protein [Vibrio cholerae]